MSFSPCGDIFVHIVRIRRNLRFFCHLWILDLLGIVSWLTCTLDRILSHISSAWDLWSLPQVRRGSTGMILENKVGKTLEFQWCLTWGSVRFGRLWTAQSSLRQAQSCREGNFWSYVWVRLSIVSPSSLVDEVLVNESASTCSCENVYFWFIDGFFLDR